MELILYPFIKNKKLESRYTEKYFYVNKNKILIEKIQYDNKNINKQIIESYKKKPNILIINFDKNTNSFIPTDIPKYPIFINNTFYISPISIQQINGFTNDSTINQFLINDFIERILQIIGGIISDKHFTYPNIEIINFNSGIKNLMYDDFKKDWFINKIPKWMTNFIPINNAGWFSSYNKIAIDYVYENYPNYKIVAELGAYFGLSSKYIAERAEKLFSFDFFQNFMLSDYVIKNITPIDTKYYFKYAKFECFHSKLSDYPNVYTIKLDCFSSVDYLFKNNINVDIFYIDFCKKDKLLIDFVDYIFKKYPKCIIIGDDAVMLNKSLEYFKNNYNYVYMYSCYICSKDTQLINLDKLYKNINDEYYKNNCNNIIELQKLDNDYKINYISGIIQNNSSYEKIMETIKILNIDPNMNSKYIFQNGNLYHFIGYNLHNNYKYYNELYKFINKEHEDTDLQNNMNLIPKEYIKYGKNKAFLFI